MIRVLSIDDSKAVHAFLDSILKDKVEIKHVYDGEQGVKTVEAGEKFDLILLDWEMPVLNGIETLKKIRSLPISTPIIMLTSKNDPTEIASALQLGANEYVMKPFTPDIILEKIDSVLGSQLSG